MVDGSPVLAHELVLRARHRRHRLEEGADLLSARACERSLHYIDVSLLRLCSEAHT